jgi:hypothetical protein
MNTVPKVPNSALFPVNEPNDADRKAAVLLLF